MYKYFILAIILFGCGCKINFDDNKPNPKPDPQPVVVDKELSNKEMSEALARLAERCLKSDIRKASSELDGTLNELVSDGVSKEYTDKVRAAVPAIGKTPPRDLTVDEISTLKGVK